MTDQGGRSAPSYATLLADAGFTFKAERWQQDPPKWIVRIESRLDAEDHDTYHSAYAETFEDALRMAWEWWSK